MLREMLLVTAYVSTSIMTYTDHSYLSKLPQIFHRIKIKRTCKT